MSSFDDARAIRSAVFALVVFSVALAVPCITRADCRPSVVAIELGHAGNSAGGYLGRAVGQTFVASDTLIRSLSVWRVPVQAGSKIGLRCYFTTTDSTGAPILDGILHESPRLLPAVVDSAAPTEFRWDFSPPLRLPAPARYAFFLALDPCLAYVDLLTTAEDADLYQDGILWLTGRTNRCDLAAGFSESFPRADLIFRIEFCGGRTSQAKPEEPERSKKSRARKSRP